MLKHVKEMSTFPSMGKTAKQVLSDASPVLWDGQHGLRGDTCTTATSTSGTRVCKGKCAVWKGWISGQDSLGSVPSKGLEEQRTEKKAECNALRKKSRDEQGMKRAGT